MMPMEYSGRLSDIGVTGVGTGADKDLLNVLFRHLGQRQYMVGQMGTGHHGLQLAHVQLNDLVVLCVLVRQ